MIFSVVDKNFVCQNLKQTDVKSFAMSNQALTFPKFETIFNSLLIQTEKFLSLMVAVNNSESNCAVAFDGPGTLAEKLRPDKEDKFHASGFQVLLLFTHNLNESDDKCTYCITFASSHLRTTENFSIITLENIILKTFNSAQTTKPRTLLIKPSASFEVNVTLNKFLLTTKKCQHGGISIYDVQKTDTILKWTICDNSTHINNIQTNHPCCW